MTRSAGVYSHTFAGQNPLMIVEAATKDDLEIILDWLFSEAEGGEQTFYGNRRLIAEGQAAGDLFVLRDAGEIVAFTLGKVGEIAIQETRPSQRGKGYGRFLAQWGIERARSADIVLMEGECSPSTSLGFWKAMGFKEMRAWYGHNPWVYLALSKPLPVPPGKPVEVLIRVFDENHLYDENELIASEHQPQASISSNGVIHLSERTPLFVPDLQMGHDVSLEIVVDGERLFFDKAKRSVAEAIGVMRDSRYEFYIDCIHPNHWQCSFFQVGPGRTRQHILLSPTADSVTATWVASKSSPDLSPWRLLGPVPQR